MKLTRIILLAVATIVLVAGPSPMVRNVSAGCDEQAYYTFDAVTIWCDFGGHDCWWCDVNRY